MRKEEFGTEVILRVGKARGEIIYPLEQHVEADEMRAFYLDVAVVPEQTHSLNVGIVENPKQAFLDTDALVTFIPGLPIGVLTADCVPILLYAPDIQGIAAVHAGWKGTLGGILDNTLDLLIERGADISKLVASVGPSITVTNYEVDQELADRFKKAGFKDFVFDFYPTGKPHISLNGINRYRMLKRGVLEKNIFVHSGCTYGSVLAKGVQYPSHRRSKGLPSRMLTFIYLNK